jgi:hypothetical protein
MITTLSTLGLAAAVSAAANVPANLSGPQSVAFTNSPVSVVACDYSSVPSLTTPFTDGYAPAFGNLQISFVNGAPVAATDVRFAVTQEGRTQIVEDRGTFSSGTTIDHTFSPVDPAAQGIADCQVQAVSFADGSSWNVNG